MPTVNVSRARLFALLGRRMSDSAFDDLCFQYGIELDQVTTEAEISGKQAAPSVQQAANANVAAPAAASASAAGSSNAAADAPEAVGDAAVVYKIEIPANRYDLLCVEGIARALRVFLQIDQTAHTYRVVAPASPEQQVRIVQTAATRSIRPFVVGAVLRNVEFTPESFASFIDLQDKLHQNIGRKRTLVAIGTHDLDTISSPFRYEALPKSEIRFVPLAEEKEFTGEELFAYYHSKQPPSHLKPYLYITESSPVQPVIYDKERRVCSLPPIINGEHSKITLQTKNVFIECTGTDATKLSVTLNQVVTMFSQYCARPFEVEQVEVVDEETGTGKMWPVLDSVEFQTDVAYINSAIGISITAEDMITYLRKMSMSSTLSPDGQRLTVQVPPTRSDVLHAADLMEDIAISYGFNNVPRTLPQVAQSGFTEVLTWVLLSYDDNYRFMQPRDVEGIQFDIKSAQSGEAVSAGQSVSSQLLSKPLVVHPLLATPRPITLSNPKSLDFQLVRTTLLPGLLKALANNQGQVNLPIRLFECGDVGFQNEESDVGAKNQRRIAALYCDVRSGFEVVQGLLDRVMAINGVRFGPSVTEHAAKCARLEAKRKAAEAAEKKRIQALQAAAKKSAGKAAAAGAAGQEAPKKEEAAPAPADATAVADSSAADEEWSVCDTFTLRASSHPSYFPGRRADVLLHRVPVAGAPQAEPIVVGTFGILHPDVMSQFQIPYVCSAMEINIEHFL